MTGQNLTDLDLLDVPSIHHAKPDEALVGDGSIVGVSLAAGARP